MYSLLTQQPKTLFQYCSNIRGNFLTLSKYPRWLIKSCACLYINLELFKNQYIRNSKLQQLEAIRSCSRYQFFTFDYIDNCEDIQKLITQQTIAHYSISSLNIKFKFILSVAIVTFRRSKLESRHRSSRHIAMFERMERFKGEGCAFRSP